MSDVTWVAHANAAALADAVAARVNQLVDSALAARGWAVLALPGGKSPAPIFDRLRQCRGDWSRVTLLPTDDRIVPIDHRLSNAALLQKHFGDTTARFVPLVTDADIPCHSAGERADAALQEVTWPPDLVWLGVGADGHAASIFEGPDFKGAVDCSSRRRAVGVRPEPLPPEAPVARVTLTCGAIRSARNLLLTLSGDAKRRIVEGALADGARPSSPIAHVLAHSRTPTEIHWSPE